MATPDPIEQEAINNRMAMKQMRLDISRVLVRWDPLCVKGLRGAERQYDAAVGPLSLMAKQGVEKMTIAREIVRIMREEWRLPPDNAKCVEVAAKIESIGAHYRGASPPRS
jgi:hypothetical protein